MAYSVSPSERRNCWLVMSDLFVDNEVDYRAVAESLGRDCPNMNRRELGVVRPNPRNFPLLTQVWAEPQTAEISINDFGASTVACVYFSGH